MSLLFDNERRHDAVQLCWRCSQH